MLIRKLFKFEGAHIVRNCSSQRCKENIHGHSYVVEVFITSDRLDKGFMVMDFTLLNQVREFIDSFDHTYTLWKGEEEEFKQFIRRYNSRVAEIPVSPTAEGYALLFFHIINSILEHTEFKNGEGNVRLASVRVHETVTGYAEAFREDMDLIRFTADEIHFSEEIRNAWRDKEWWTKINPLHH
ncbi:6-carboxytetrahydropterin synthase [Porphyromonadaceae bacterium OttesenSCG-928-L07]|nr:6-carboxytetrahydropterin synthase [Porphyromonadaceae bacterium OttesenSCG-928-L07]MDL2252196.1 6-carboxytetrahydropterin synthase [Odoribacter sp. OttesenSCG-928-J03]